MGEKVCARNLLDLVFFLTHFQSIDSVEIFFFKELLLQVENKLSLHSLYKRGKKEWEFSSAGSEHLPYKQRVGGSNPSTPTFNPDDLGIFLFYGLLVFYIGINPLV